MHVLSGLLFLFNLYLVVCYKYNTIKYQLCLTLPKEHRI